MSPRARCRSSRSTPSATPTRSSPSCATSTTTAWGSRSSPSCASRATPSTTCSCRTRSSTPSTTPSPGSPRPPPTCVPSSSWARRWRRAPGVYNCGVVIHGGRSPRRRAEVLPAHLPRVLRAAPLRPRRRPARPDHRRRRRPASRSDPTCSSGPTDVPGFVLHVEVCEDMWVPVPPSHEAALAGATVLHEHLRLADHRLARRGPPPARPQRLGALPRRLPLCRRRRGGELDRPVVGRHDDGLRERRPARARASASPRGPAPSVADIDLDLLRQERQRQGTFDDNRRTPRRPHRAASAPSSSSSTRRPATSGCSARSTASPSCPTTRTRLALDCYEAYNIQVSGLEQRLRAIGARPKVVIGVSRRPRLDPRAHRRGQGHGPARPAAQRHPRLHDARLRDERPARRATPSHLMESLGVTWEELDIRPAATQMLEATWATRSAAARRSTTSPSRTSRPACAPTTSSASPTSAAASCSAPATCPSSRSAGAPTASATRWRTTASTPACRRR